MFKVGRHGMHMLLLSVSKADRSFESARTIDLAGKMR
jgi:hypothetical protein